MKGRQSVRRTDTSNGAVGFSMLLLGQHQTRLRNVLAFRN